MNNGKIKTVEWDSFQVNGEQDKFRLNISGFKSGSSGLGDALNYHNGQKFSTKDQDNDPYGPDNCSHLVGGNDGWWFNKCGRSLNRGDGKGPEYNNKFYEESIMILKR